MNILVIGGMKSGKRTLTEVLVNRNAVIPHINFSIFGYDNFIECTYNETNNVSLTVIPQNKNYDWISNILSVKGNLEIDSETIRITISAQDFTSCYHDILGMDDHLYNLPFKIKRINISINNDFLKDNKISIRNHTFYDNHDTFERDCNTADLIIFITSATFYCSKTECEVVKLIPQEKLIIVVNRMDCIPFKDIDSIKGWIEQKWDKESAYPISYISAIQALYSLEEKNLNKYMASGMPHLLSNLRLNFNLKI